jgi:excisionase family DNA binding protein
VLKEKPAVTVPEAAELLGVPRHTVYILIRTGKVRYQRLGKRHLIHRRDLAEYIEKSWKREGQDSRVRQETR